MPIMFKRGIYKIWRRECIEKEMNIHSKIGLFVII